jgi:hypothetical protein
VAVEVVVVAAVPPDLEDLAVEGPLGSPDRAPNRAFAVGVVAQVGRESPQRPSEGAEAVVAVEVVVSGTVAPDLADLTVEVALGAIDRVLELALAPGVAPDVPGELGKRSAQGAERVGPVEIAVASAVADDLADERTVVA